jgi:hypothetical protein
MPTRPTKRAKTRRLPVLLGFAPLEASRFKGGSSPPGIPRDRPPVRLGRKPRKPGMKEVIVGHDQLAGFCGSGVLVDVPFAENRRLVAAWTERP